MHTCSEDLVEFLSQKDFHESGCLEKLGFLETVKSEAEWRLEDDFGTNGCQF